MVERMRFGFLLASLLCTPPWWSANGIVPCWALTLATPASQDEQSLRNRYAQARQTRIEQGARAAAPLYRDLLQYNNADMSTASRLSSSEATIRRLETIFAEIDDTCRFQDLAEILRAHDFCSNEIASRLAVPSQFRHAQAPLFLTPGAAGTCHDWNEQAPDALDLFIALFLVGLVVPRDLLRKRIGEEEYQVLTDVGLLVNCDVDDSLVFSLVQLTPIDLKHSDNETLYVMTDWHPRVLSLTTISEQADGTEDAVMYIGPDSLALIQNWIDQDQANQKSLAGQHDMTILLDLCTGSGVQALAALLVHPRARAVCLDVNSRALRFTAMNAALNGVRDRVTLAKGDILAGQGCLWDETGTTVRRRASLRDLLIEAASSSAASSGPFDLVTANPPFLPVPRDIPSTKHGLFSIGGSSGEAVLLACIRLAFDVLAPGAVLAIVSEFFLGENQDVQGLLDRIAEACMPPSTSSSSMRGMLFTNEFPIDADTYAKLRSDSTDEYQAWKDHLQAQEILFVSPGILYLRKEIEGLRQNIYNLSHSIVPKSQFGSIWTPSNPEAVEFTLAKATRFFNE